MPTEPSGRSEVLPRLPPEALEFFRLAKRLGVDAAQIRLALQRAVGHSVSRSDLPSLPLACWLVATDALENRVSDDSPPAAVRRGVAAQRQWTAGPPLGGTPSQPLSAASYRKRATRLVEAANLGSSRVQWALQRARKRLHLVNVDGSIPSSQEEELYRLALEELVTLASRTTAERRQQEGRQGWTAYDGPLSAY